MREILFRGKRTDNGEWMQGQLLYFKSSVGAKEFALIVESCEWDNSNEWFNLGKRAKVIPETVGQYTGLTDKNGKKIFEGDIVLFPWGEKREVFSVEFVEGEFEAIPKRKSTDIWCIRIGSYASEFEVIGNIHDNSELLKGGDE